MKCWLRVVLLCCVSLAALADNSPDAQFALAQQALRNGDAETALAVLVPLRDHYPRNVDYVFAYGMALARIGEEASALAELRYAIELAPDYEDVWRLHHALLLKAGDSAALDTYREQAAERFPAATWWRTPDAEPRYPWILTAGAGFDFLDNGQPNWDNQFAELRWERSELQRYAMSVSRHARNNNSDLSLGAGAEFSIGQWTTGGRIAGSGSADFMPEIGVDVYAGRALGEGWAATLRYRNRRYSNATVGTVVVTMENYFGDWRIAYDLGVSHLSGSSGFMNHVIGGNWYYRDESTIGLSFSTGREAEAIGGGQVLETDVSGISLTGRHQFTQRLGLQWWIGIHDQGELYRRQFLGMAVSIRI